MAKRKRRKRRARKSPPQTWGWEWQVLSEMTLDPADVEPRDDAPSPPPPEWWDGLDKESEKWESKPTSGQSGSSERRRGSLLSSGLSVPSLPPLSAGLPDTSLKGSDVCAFNAQAERRFVETLLAWLEQAGELERAFVRRNMAFSLDVSPRTVERYIEKYCAELSPWFELVNGTIRRKG